MNKKNVQVYASLAEIVSAVAIIISLLYVAYEFRRTETLSSNEVDIMIFERVREANTMLIENGELARIVIQANSRPEALSESDRLRYLAYQHIFFDRWETAWIYYQDGILGGAPPALRLDREPAQLHRRGIPAARGCQRRGEVSENPGTATAPSSRRSSNRP